MSQEENNQSGKPSSIDDIRSLADVIANAPPAYGASELRDVVPADQAKPEEPAQAPEPAVEPEDDFEPVSVLGASEPEQPEPAPVARPIDPREQKLRQLSDQENQARIRTFAAQFADWELGKHYYKGMNMNVTFDKSPFSPLPEDEKDQDRYGIPLSTFPYHLNEQMQDAVTEFDASRDNNSRHYMNMLTAARFSQYADPSIQNSFEREGSEWRTHVQTKNGPIKPQALTADTQSKELFNLSAMSRVISALNIGQSIRIPLYHSGFWVDMAPAAMWQRQEFNSRLAEERLQAARNTYGRAFSNTTAVFTGHIFNFVLGFIRGSSLKVGSEIQDYVDMRDIPTLVWGLARATWPRGWRYFRAVPGEPNSPDSIVSQMLNIGEMIKNDNSQFSDWQRAFMADTRQRSDVDPSALERYKEEFTIGRDVEFIANPDAPEGDQVRFTIGVPSALEHIASGERWLSEVADTYQKIPNRSTNTTTRDNFIMEQTRLTRMRMYSHYVKRIFVGNNEIPSQNDKEAALSWISGDDVLRERFIDFISQYKTDSIVTAFGIPTADEVTVPMKNHPHLLAVDPLQLFFIRLAQEKSSSMQ